MQAFLKESLRAQQIKVQQIAKQSYSKTLKAKHDKNKIFVRFCIVFT